VGFARGHWGNSKFHFFSFLASATLFPSPPPSAPGNRMWDPPAEESADVYLPLEGAAADLSPKWSEEEFDWLLDALREDESSGSAIKGRSKNKEPRLIARRNHISEAGLATGSVERTVQPAETMPQPKTKPSVVSTTKPALQRRNNKASKHAKKLQRFTYPLSALDVKIKDCNVGGGVSLCLYMSRQSGRGENQNGRVIKFGANCKKCGLVHLIESRKASEYNEFRYDASGAPLSAEAVLERIQEFIDARKQLPNGWFKSKMC